MSGRVSACDIMLRRKVCSDVETLVPCKDDELLRASLRLRNPKALGYVRRFEARRQFEVWRCARRRLSGIHIVAHSRRGRAST